MNKKQRNNLVRIIIAAVLVIALLFVHLSRPVMFLLYLIPYLIVGYDILRKAWKGILNRQPLDENLLMAIATLGALALAVMQTGDFTEAVAVMLFYQIGELFQSYAVGRSRRNIGELMDIRPDYANVETPDGMEQTDPDEVEVGTIIIVQPGEKVPIDGIVVEGVAGLDTSALTGESVPRSVKPGDAVISGCINMNGVLRIQTTHEFEESTASKILDLVENASSRKSRSEQFISRFARVYTPVVVISAVLLALVPPVVRMGVLGMSPEWAGWLYRALTFLVISCPCALVISIPLSFFAGLGGASRAGILIKGSNFLEALSKVKTVVMDKTGTLTQGVFRVTEIHPASSFSVEDLLRIAATAEAHSSHPIAAALKTAYAQQAGMPGTRLAGAAEEIEEIAGHGISARIDGQQVAIGNRKMMARAGITEQALTSAQEISAAAAGGSRVYLAVDGVYAGCMVISDVVKETAAQAISDLRACGVNRTVMLTGDAAASAQAVGRSLGMDEIYSDLLPADKVMQVERLLTCLGGVDDAGGAGQEDDRQFARRDKLAFAGDGINDAPVLSRADIGIAMGALGSDAAIEAADVVLMDDDPRKIAGAIRLARRCMRIVYENIWFAIGIKVLCLLLSALGLVGMWAAIFADVGVMVLAVLNAMRALMVPESGGKTE